MLKRIIEKQLISRPLRIEDPGAWYHIMNRGRRKEEIYTEPNDYRLFLETLEDVLLGGRMNVVENKYKI